MALPISYFYFVAKKNPFNVRQLLGFNFLGFGGVILLTMLIVPLPFLGTAPLITAFKNLYHVYPSPTPTDCATVLSSLIGNFQYLAEETDFFLLFTAMAGFLLLRKQQNRIFIFLLLWFLSPFLAYSSMLHLLSPSSRYLLIALPPLLTATGYLFAKLWSLPNKLFRLICVLSWLLLQFFFAAHAYPVLNFRHHHAVSSDFGRWVAAHTEKDAIIICGDEKSFLKDYGARENATSPTTREDFQNIKEAIKNRKPVYVLIPDHCPPWSQFLSRLKDKYQVQLMGESTFEGWQRSTTRLTLWQVKLYKVEWPSSLGEKK